MSRPWQVRQDIDLRGLNTFRVAARTPCLLDVQDSAALPDALAHAPDGMVLGGGSNLLLVGAVPPLLRLQGNAVEVEESASGQVRVRCEAGLAWHALVMRLADAGVWGLENLALIPGTVGAAPVQNIGAYGVEVAEHVVQVEAWDREAQQWRTFDRAGCGFGYRHSVFKHAPDRYVITAVTFELQRAPAPRLNYAGLAETLSQAGVTAPSARAVADAVIALRRAKLPDPAVLGNAGSFFKNPVLDSAQADALHEANPGLPRYRVAPGSTKVSAAWLIEQCGWKGHRDGDAGVSSHHALVLVNHGEATGAQLLALARRIADSVRARFGVAIEPEPRIVGARW